MDNPKTQIHVVSDTWIGALKYTKYIIWYISNNRLEKSIFLYKRLTTSTNKLNNKPNPKHKGSKAYKYMSMRDIDTFSID